MKKLTLLLASLGAGLLLVGGTVAAYIVQAADTIGVRVSPGSLDTDKTGRVTLSWGSNTMHRVGNLEPNTETPIGEVKLAASVDPSEVSFAYDGAFGVKIENLSLAASHTVDLLDKLTFKVYEDSVGDGEHYGAATTLSAATTVSGYKVVQQPFNTTSGHMFKVSVTLNATAGDDFYAELCEQTANATFTWGVRSGSEDIDTADMGNVYFAVPSLASGEKLFVHAYQGDKAAASYPGLEMSYVYDIKESETTKKLYTAAFDKVKYTNFKFIKATPQEAPATGYDYTVLATAAYSELSHYTDGNPYYNGSAWGLKPDEALALYYVRGVINGADHWGDNLAALALSENTSQAGEYLINNVQLVAGDAFKIYVPGQDEYFAPNGEDFNVHAKDSEYEGPGIPGYYSIYVRTTNNEGWTQCLGDKGNTYYMYIAWVATLGS